MTLNGQSLSRLSVVALAVLFGAATVFVEATPVASDSLTGYDALDRPTLVSYGDVETAPTAASCSGGNLTYDTAGRTQTWNGWTFAYDSQGRMTSACKSPTCAAGFDRVEFAYDGEGHRTSLKTTSAAGAVATRDFRYQGSAIVEEQLTDAAHPAPGTVVRSYISDDAGSAVKLIIAAGEPGAGTYLVTWNGHGDALALWRQNSDGTLTLANSYTYTTWGGPTTTTHNGIGDLGFRFTYVGEFDVQWDDAFGLGLAYMHARHYSPTLGRFLQPDPDGSEANLYAYTANNPITELDPDGTCFILCAVLNAAIDTAIYLATTENATLEGAAGAAAVGAGSGFLGVGLLSKVAKAGAVARLVSNASKVVSYGRRGSPAHRAGIAQAEQRLQVRGYSTLSGGSLPERATRLATGRLRYADLVMERAGHRVAIQVGRRTKSGLPVWRERAPLSDLRGSGQFDHVYFLRY